MRRDGKEQDRTRSGMRQDLYRMVPDCGKSPKTLYTFMALEPLVLRQW
jgi:hypothetical protein